MLIVRIVRIARTVESPFVRASGLLIRLTADSSITAAATLCLNPNLTQEWDCVSLSLQREREIVSQSHSRETKGRQILVSALKSAEGLLYNNNHLSLSITVRLPHSDTGETNITIRLCVTQKRKGEKYSKTERKVLWLKRLMTETSDDWCIWLLMHLMTEFRM